MPVSCSTSLWRLLSLRSDQASPDLIDAAIRDNSRLAGTNLWVLMFAIIIASVGLNVNSTAVIIGAMLISPLMGPIIAVGYGAGIHDYGLIRQSFRSLGIFVGISLLASTTYFLLSPLSHAYSELLARTSPTLWDVLIAFFGGAAGMIGLTRKEKTTLIPGVAIATALMPPLCTAGYGIATGQLQFFLGAFYLFLINSVFIALATLAIVRVLRLPHHTFPDEAARLRGRAVITLAVLLMLVPSIYLAYRLVQEEIFTATAQRFVEDSIAPHEDVALVLSDIDPKQRSIVLTLFGVGVTPEFEQELNRKLSAHGLNGVALRVRHPSEAKLDLTTFQGAVAATKENAARIAALEARDTIKQAVAIDTAALEAEIRALFPAVKDMKVTNRAPKITGANARDVILVAIEPVKSFPASEAARLKRWLVTRFPDADVKVVVGRLF